MGFTKEDTKAIKGIAICFMLYHHLFAYPEKIREGIGFISMASFGGTTLSTYLGQFGRICMPMFLFLSGYGVYLSSVRCGDVKKMSRNRIWGLYKTVWKVFVLTLPVSLYIFRYRGSLLIKDVVCNFLGISCTFNEEWWFILPFAVLLVLFPAMKRIIDRERADIFTDLLILLTYSAIYNYIIPQIIELPALSGLKSSVFWHKTNEMLSILPAFVLGCIFAKYAILDTIKEKCAGKAIWCVLSLACMAALFYLHLYNYMYYDFINSAVLISCITILLPARILKWPFRLFEKLGEESTYIWLTHTFFCSYWCQRLIFAPRYSPLIFLLLLAVSYCAAKIIRLFWNFIGRTVKKEKSVRQVG